MALTPSNMLPLGTLAPGFSLPSTSGETVSLDYFNESPALLVAFICNHCPYVKHIQSGFTSMADEYIAKGVAFVAISANDVDAYPDDNFVNMKKESEQAGYGFPYLLDETQEVAKAYDAACTPDFFLFDGERKLVYRGQMDDSRPGSEIPVTGKDLRAAMDAVLVGQPVSAEQTPSVGCNIKWKSGNAPE